MATLGSVAVLCLGVAVGTVEDVPPPSPPAAAIAAAAETRAFDLAPGTRLRVTAAGRTKPVVGVLEAERDGRLWLGEGRQGDPVSVPLDTVTRIERQRGARRHALGGAARGLALGAASGLLLHTFGCSSSDCDGVTVVELSAVTTLAGGALGLVVGALVQTDVWEPVATPRLRVGLTLSPRGPAVSLRF